MKEKLQSLNFVEEERAELATDKAIRKSNKFDECAFESQVLEQKIKCE